MRNVLTLLFSIALVMPAAGQRPLLVSYQGLLTDNHGIPLSDGPVSMTFALYPTEEGGTAEWVEARSVEVNSGIVNVYLGTETPLPQALFDRQLWLGITVEDDPELSPRTFLAVSPYAATLYAPTNPGGLPDGDPCTEWTECQSGSCTDGVCCATACDGTCERCDGPSPGTCEPIDAYTDPDNECPGRFCDGAGSCKLTDGSPCVAHSDCISTNCVDGYCCNQACGGNCETCAGSALGTCEFVEPGTDPDAECGLYYCNGSGVCETSCLTEADCKPGYICDNGSCAPL